MKIPVMIVAVVPIGDELKVYRAEADTFDECVAELNKMRAQPAPAPDPCTTLHIGDLG